MNPGEIFEAVKEMRRAQRDAARHDGADPLARRVARQKEDIIDREIKRVEMLEADRRQLRIDFDTSTNH